MSAEPSKAPVPPIPPRTPSFVKLAPPPPKAQTAIPDVQKDSKEVVQSEKADAEKENDEEIKPQRTFWQIPFVQDVLPFLTSLTIHLVIVALGILTYKTIEVVVAASKEPMVIPSEVIIEGAEVGGIPHPGLGGDETRDAAQDQFKDIPPDSSGIAERPSDSLQQALKGGGAGENSDSDIAIGLQSGAFGKGSGTGSGVGTGIGSGTGDGGGPLAPFGIPGGGGGIGPKSPFMGISGNAMRVVYLCDATGTMLSVFDDLRVELRKAIDTLKPVQAFNVVFFSDDSFTTLDKNGLVMALPEMKRKAYDFLDSSAAHGSTNPIPAIRASFAMQPKPQLIYCLTDGFDAVSSYQEVIDEFRKLNKDKKIKVNTIMIKSSDDPELEKVLKTIADENGGLFKMVRKDDFGNH